MTTLTTAGRPPTDHTASGAIRLLLTLCGLTALLLTSATLATPARAADAPAASQPPTRAAYLADRLRENPVHVTDQLPRAVPRSMAPDFARLAQRTGVPTYVLVLPNQSASGEDLLGTVHDRLRRDGLFVLLDESGVRKATAYGVSAPAEAARTTTVFELPYDAGPLRSFERFVDVVAQGPEKAEALAGAAREKFRDGNEPEAMYIGPSDRQNQSFVTGIALTGVPLTILLLAPCVRRARRRFPRATPPGSTADRPASTRPKWRRLLTPSLALAVALAAAIALTAPLVFDQTKRRAAPLPTSGEMTARVERVAEGLARDPVYVDPESPRVLDATQFSRLHDRIERFGRSEGGGPVYVTVVPHLSEDESAGDEELFAAAVRARLGKADAVGETDGVYVSADPLTGYIDVFNHGLRLDSRRLLFDLPESIAYGDDRANAADDHLMGERLDALMTHLDESPRTDGPTSSGDPLPAPSPQAENSLPPLFATDFWPGLFVGVIAALLLLGLVAGTLGIVGAVLRRRSPAPLPTQALPLVSPREPSEAYLRRTARTELQAASLAFASVCDAEGEGSASRIGPAWNRFDAAMLLVGGDMDGLRSPGTDPATLLAVIVLARGARNALQGDTNDRCCGVNPLHGPSAGRRHVRISAEGNRRRMLSLCPLCLDSAVAAPRELRERMLTLPGPTGTRVPYDEPEGSPLSVLGDGISRLADRVRDSAHVH
ncbi:hypothetical protein [Streptomyces lancefieldiae]|uniref:DUF4350 domain-containing protein n=1 Tax=Streptomyces lancefieldiae TaxID=3075520 RepID=A0ABU3AYR7_9ACTN|nr:hypothetical protein [Streptomyces sp. DSM 40712]MDT0614233.1 hypothetical protein [Streptomyces sp. DSM 40712]